MPTQNYISCNTYVSCVVYSRWTGGCFSLTWKILRSKDNCTCFPEFCLKDRTRSAALASLFQPSPSNSLALIKEGQQGDRWWKMFPGSSKLIWFRNHFKGRGQEHSSWFYICGAASVRSLLIFSSVLGCLENIGWRNLAAWLSLLQKRHNYTFFSPGTILRIFYLALNTAFKTQSQPLTANNLEFVILKLQREFPSITTNEWEPHSW